MTTQSENTTNTVDESISRWIDRRTDLEAERRYLERRLAMVQSLEKLIADRARYAEQQCLKMSEKKS